MRGKVQNFDTFREVLLIASEWMVKSEELSMLLLINSIENTELVFCLRYVSFHLILNLQREKSSQQKEFMIDMEPCDTSIPTIISSQTRVALGMDVSHGLMAIMTNI